MRQMISAAPWFPGCQEKQRQIGSLGDSLQQKQCLFWSRAPLPAVTIAGGQVISPQGSLSIPTLPSTLLPQTSAPIPASVHCPSFLRLPHQPINFQHLLFLLSQAIPIFIATHYIYFWSIISAISCRRQLQYQRQLTSTKCLLCARHCANCFAYIVSFNAHHTLQWVLLVFPFNS